LEKPLNAQLTEADGVAATRLAIAPTTTPTKPTAAPGIGSVITPVITAANNAKKYHALPVRPLGVGMSAIRIPTMIGIVPFSIVRVLFVRVILLRFKMITILKIKEKIILHIEIVPYCCALRVK
jgi:hypothetical protein